MPQQPPQKPKPEQVVIRDFGGLMSNADPHDLPAGVAVNQVNVVSLRPGELRVRPGFAVVRFDS